ncbi:MAG: radical SAM protein [Candidatus Omnitrophota bacterium]
MMVFSEVISIDEKILTKACDTDIYVNITYEAQLGKDESISFEAGNYSYNTRVLYGGIRLFCLKIPVLELKKENGLSFKTNAKLAVKEISYSYDYYDYLNIRSKYTDDPEVKFREKETLDLSKDIGFMIQWFVTWRCNFRCSYCWQINRYDIYRKDASNKIEISSEKWAQKFNELKPKSIYFTGGEPFLHKDFLTIIDMLDKKIDLVMTSNFSDIIDINRFIKTVRPNRFKDLMFSLHPTQYNAEKFFEKVALLVKNKFKNLGVEMVLAPENLSYAELVLDRCKKLNIRVIFDNCVMEGENPGLTDPVYLNTVDSFMRRAAEYNEALWRSNLYCVMATKYYKFKSLFKKTRNNGGNFFSKAPLFCTAGLNRIVLDNKGDAYTCMSAIDRSKLFTQDSLPHYRPIGNIFSEDFSLLKKPIICWESFRCSACDSQYLYNAWNEIKMDKIKEVLPLPE